MDVYGIVYCSWFGNPCKFSLSFYDDRGIHYLAMRHLSSQLVVIQMRLFPPTHIHKHTHSGLCLCMSGLDSAKTIIREGAKEIAWLLMIFCNGHRYIANAFFCQRVCTTSLNWTKWPIEECAHLFTLDKMAHSNISVNKRFHCILLCYNSWCSCVIQYFLLRIDPFHNQRLFVAFTSAVHVHTLSFHCCVWCHWSPQC